MAQNAANHSPSPGGEGRGEGGRITDFVASSIFTSPTENIEEAFFNLRLTRCPVRDA
jgi:hypothetical protein